MRYRQIPYLIGAIAGFLLGSLVRFEPSTKSVKLQKLVYVITPTHARAQQKAELTRLSYTLRLAGNIHWIVVEDAEEKTSLVTNFLSSCGLPFTHLNALTPAEFKLKAKDPNWLKPRGVLQRNAALQYVRQWVDNDDAVVYFADDDNTYDVRLFDEMRSTNKVSVWPVGIVGGLMVEKPIVIDGRVKRFNAVFRPNRPYPIDMAAFAINLKLLRSNPTALFSLNVQRGYQESHLLSQLIKGWEELEPKADNCTRVLVWHTRTEVPNLKAEAKLSVPSNLHMEV